MDTLSTLEKVAVGAVAVVAAVVVLPAAAGCYVVN
jgi:hypothetical protein